MAWEVFTKKFWLGEVEADPVYERYNSEYDATLAELEDEDDFVSVEDLVEEVDELMEQANEFVDEAEDIIDEILARTDELDEPDQIDTVEEEGVVYLRVWYPLHTEF